MGFMGMPYRIAAKGGGYKVTSPHHPGGFSKHPQSKAMARKQMVAIMVNSHEDAGGNKVAARKRVGVRKKP